MAHVAPGNMTRDELDVALAEYGSLRQEIDARAKRLHQILTTQLFVAGAIFAFALGTAPNAGNPAVLLILPYTSFLLLGRFADQQHAVNRITDFLRDNLSPRMPGRLHWEEWSDKNRRPQVNQFWLGPVLLAFPGASLLAVLGGFEPAYSTYDGLRDAGLLAIWFGGVLLTVWQVVIVVGAIQAFLRRIREASGTP